MSNTLITPTQVTRKALMVLHQKLNFVGNVTRDYDDSYAKKGAKIGNTLKVRLPNQYAVRSGATLSAQDTVEQTVDLTVNSQKGVDLNFTSQDLTMSLDDFNERILEPAMSALAANIEADALNMVTDVYNSIWNGTAASSYNQVLDGRVIMNRFLAPFDKRTALMSSLDMADVVKDTKTLFQDEKSLAKQFKEGYVGRAAGFDWNENTLLPSFTRGAGNGAYTTDTRTSALAQDGTAYSQITVATGTGALNVGDVFTIANVFKAHPETKANTGVLHQFVVTQAYAGGAGAVSISPAIVVANGNTIAKANVVIPATSATAAITFAGTASTAVGTSLLFQEGAFAFATADLVMPDGVDFKARQVVDGISMRIVRMYDINNDKFPCRIDVLYGYKTLRAGLACRLHNH